ncbi:MAG: hypothetical protein ACYDBB_13410 [Armatimonadota bacterium]
MNQQPETSTPPPLRRLWHRRWFRVCVFFVLLIVGCWTIHRLLNPQLHPVTRRLLPKDYTLTFANTMGYPVAQHRISMKESDITWLDERCQPIPGATGHTYEFIQMSPGGQVNGRCGPSKSTRSA